MSESTDPAAPPHASRLARHRRAARALLWFERIWVAGAPLVGVIALFTVAALLGLFAALPAWAHATLLALFAVAALAALGLGAARLRRPRALEIDRRLEQEAGLRHRPLAILQDRPGVADAAGMALWRAHQARAEAAIAGLRLFWPRPGLAAHDRRALRALLLLGLLAALVIAGEEGPARLRQALLPPLLTGPGAPDTQLAAWITPPAYTGLAPLFLRPGQTGISVPEGARLVVSVTGGSGEPGIAYAGAALTPGQLGPGSWQAEQVLRGGGRLEVRRHGSALGAWDIATIADQPPTARFPSPPVGLPRSHELRIPWQAGDDYGVTSLRAVIRLQARPELPPLVLNIPLSGTPKAAHGAFQRDLTPNPWAGLPVTIELVARDAPGQEGHSDQAKLVLPEHVFRHPLARALAELRKQLSLHPEDQRGAAAVVRALAGEPELTENDAGVMLNMAAIAGLLRHGRDADTVAQAQAQMWVLALQLDEDSTSRAARALAQAREAARDALNQLRQSQAQTRNGKPDAAKQQALDQKLEALRQAIQRHLQALAQQAMRDHTALPYDPDAQHLTSQDIDRMMQQMQQALQQGRTEDAARELAQMEKLLDQLQAAEAQQGQQQRGQQGQRQRGQQQMGAVQDLAQRESALQQQAAGRGQNQQAQNQQAQNQQGQNQQGQSRNGQTQSSQRDTDQRVQDALRRALGELMQQYGDLTGQIPQPLGEADQDKVLYVART